MAHPVLLLLSGPNLNLLGTRKPEIYGTQTLNDHVQAARRQADSHGYELEHLQSNHEGDLVDAIQNAIARVDAVIINAAAFTHYSWALHDALEAFDAPIIELHISDPRKREKWRHFSVIEPLATKVVSGLGAAGYPAAIDEAVKAVEAVAAAAAITTDASPKDPGL